VGATTLRRELSKPEVVDYGKVKDLKLVRTYDFSIIPRYLFEQIKGRRLNVDKLYQFGGEIAQSPLTLLYVLVDENYVIKGFLWGAINPMTETLQVHYFSMDPEYQNHGQALVYVTYELLGKITKELGLETIEWVTSRPRAFEKLGAKRSKFVLMEV